MSVCSTGHICGMCAFVGTGLITLLCLHSEQLECIIPQHIGLVFALESSHVLNTNPKYVNHLSFDFQRMWHDFHDNLLVLNF